MLFLFAGEETVKESNKKVNKMFNIMYLVKNNTKEFKILFIPTNLVHFLCNKVTVILLNSIPLITNIIDNY